MHFKLKKATEAYELSINNVNLAEKEKIERTIKGITEEIENCTVNISV